jgi:TolA-binding protein
MESHTKQNQTETGNKKFLSQIKNTVESHSSRLEQMEDRISRCKNKIDIKEQNRRMLRQKTQKLQKEYELCNSITRPNLQIMGIEKGEEV